MKIQTKFIAIALLAVASVVTSGIYQNASLLKIDHEASRADTISQAIRSHMDGDMMHDAIRGDIFKAALALRNQDEKGIVASAADIKAHGDKFRENLTLNLSRDLPADLLTLLKETQPEVEAYVTEATGYIEAASMDLRDGGVRAVAALPAFEEAFTRLEHSQEKIGDAIEKQAERIRTEMGVHTARAEKVGIVLAVLTVLLSLFVPVYASFILFRPLRRLLRVMHELAGGTVDMTVPYQQRADEVGEIATSLLVFRDNAEQKLFLEKEQESTARRAEAARKKGMHDMADTFEGNVKGVVEGVASASTEMDMTARDVLRQSTQSAGKLAELAQGIMTAMHNVQTVAGAATELSASISEINAQVTRSVKITSGAVQEANRAGATSSSLAEAAQKIGSVLNVINEIAGQINLLALNATIEAARAGEAGKGFAVVASEVKNLANQTTKATQEIEGQISMIQGAAGDTVAVIQQITRTIGDINGISSSIAAAVEEQGMATQEIARNVQQASDITTVISGSAEEVRHTAASVSAAATQMVDAASELSRQSESLRGQVTEFLSGVRSA